MKKFLWAALVRTQFKPGLQVSVLCTAVLIGSLSGSLLRAAPLAAHEMPRMSTTGASSSSRKTPEHHHKTLEIAAGQPVPTVKIVVSPDSVQGWNLEMRITNFRLAPENINTKSLTTEGHAHLYVDGKKITRLYGPWYYLSDLKPGQHKITVMLNANGHEQLTYNGRPIEDSVVIQVPPSPNNP